MGAQFRFGLVQRLQRRAGKLELTTRFERDRPATIGIEETDDVRPVRDRLPANAGGEALEKSTYAARSLVGNGRKIVLIKAEFLVLGANTEVRRRLFALRKPGDEFIPAFDGRRIGLVAGHGISWAKNPAEERAGVRLLRGHGETWQCE